MAPAWVCGEAADPCSSHGKSARKLFGDPFFHGFWLCVAWVRTKLYLTHASHIYFCILTLQAMRRGRHAVIEFLAKTYATSKKHMFDVFLQTNAKKQQYDPKK